MNAELDPVRRWIALPRRLYLDTGALQTLYDYGEAIWEGEPFVPEPRDAGVSGLGEEVDALRMIMAVNERAGFEFVVTNASLREVSRRNERQYTKWVYDVLDTWLIQSQGQRPKPTHHQRPGSVSAKDWLLLQDALAFDCDALLTIERKLSTQANVIDRMTGLAVMRPTTYWTLLDPWANLYY